MSGLDALVGRWTTEMTHPALPGTVVHGAVAFEWLEGEKFLIQRSRTDHPDFPDSIALIGDTGGEHLSMHYFDSRGVHRIYSLDLSGGTLRIWRDEPAFAQRFSAPVTRDTIAGVWQLSRDGSTWEDDLEITFSR